MNADINYDNLVRSILLSGSKKDDRTGVGTISIFGTQHRYDINNSFPLITSKKIYWKGVVEELLWMLRGSTNAKELQDKNVHIWDGNSSREFLNSLNLSYPEGHLGPVYGHQWRHFNAEYVDANTDYANQGVDQIKEIIHLLRNNPSSRRIILCSWNPCQTHNMALPPCHTVAQFYVSENKLSCQLYQRSADVGLGVPFNIASYSLLTHILAKMTSLIPHEFIHTIGDAHIYNNHIEIIKQQLENDTFKSPKLIIKNIKENIEDYSFDDFQLIDYEYSSGSFMKMAV